MNEYWFKPRRYGLGAYPSSWEGWLATGAFVASVFFISTAFPPDHRPLAFYGAVASAALAFVWLAWRKTEGGWRWRWGADD